jgi:hypothetical protein
MAGSGLHEAVKGPASIPLVLILCLASSGVGGIGWKQAGTLGAELEEAKKDVVNLRIEVGVLKRANEDKNTENDRRFSEVTQELKEMKRTLDHVAEKVGAKP